MPLLLRALAVVLALWTAAGAGAQDPVWKTVYLYDEDFANLAFHDIHWPGPDCMIALGVETRRGRGRSVAVISTDAGRTWALTPLKSHARSAYFLNDRLGWIVTTAGLERTNDCGRTWEKMGREPDLVRVWFRDEALGWAAGLQRKSLATRDGGRTWNPIDVINPLEFETDRSIFAWLEIWNEQWGIMSGRHYPDRLPPSGLIWLDPSELRRRVGLPYTTLLLQTIDGGQTWRGYTASLHGRVTRVRLGPGGAGIVVMEYEQSFEWPSQVYGMRVGEQPLTSIYRDKYHFITDGQVGRDGWTYLAGVEVPGSVRLPVPGKVKIVRSRDRKNWTPVPVDYRAAAGKIWLAAGPGRDLVAITDTGMILRLE